MLLPVGNPLIPYETPYHVVEVIIQLLKQTFTELPEGYPFRFVPGNYEATGVLFDTAYNKESVARGKPLVVVSRGPQSAGVQVVGDRAEVYGMVGRQHVDSLTTLVNSSINVRIFSRRPAEVEILAQHIFAFVMCCRTVLNHTMHIHMISGTTLSEVQRMEKDAETYMAIISCEYSLQAQWTRKIDGALHDINVHLNDTENIADLRESLSQEVTGGNI